MKQTNLLSFKEETSIIKDLLVFDLKYIPPLQYFYVRDELKKIDLSVKKFIKFGKQENLFIYGSAGSGKTASIKLLDKESKKKNLDVRFHYVSGRESYTEYKVLTRLYGKVIDPNILINKLSEKLTGKNVIVIDEADRIESQDLSNLCFLFSRWGEAVSVPEDSYVSLILITNNYNLLKMLQATPHDSVISSLQPEQVFYRPYSKKELFEILRLRAEEGLIDGSWDDEILYAIAERCECEHRGDARYAILTLEKIAVDCEFKGKKRITNDVDLDEIFDYAITKLDSRTVRNLDNQSVAILYSILMCREKTVEDIYIKYLDVCNDISLKPLKKRRIYSYMQMLQGLGLISLYKLKSEGRGRPKLCAEVTVDENVVVNRLKAIGGGSYGGH
jgi:Cdc6-like AAA superfamily ATPase